MNSTHKFTWLLMVVTILTITNCKGRSQSMSAVGEPHDTASMMLDTASMMKVTREGLSPAEQMNTFALQLFLRLHKTKQGVQNFVVSPLSVATLISIITHGAEGETLHELTTALGMDTTVVESLLPQLEQKADSFVSLRMANMLATRPDIPLRKEFTNTIARHYPHTVTAVLDLKNAKERQKIDQWCKQQTEGMIPQITDENDTATVLLSAICFEALWEKPFEDIPRMSFENIDKSRVLLPGMSRLADMMVEQRERYVSLGLNYHGGRYKMLLLLPNEDESIDHVLLVNTVVKKRQERSKLEYRLQLEHKKVRFVGETRINA